MNVRYHSPRSSTRLLVVYYVHNVKQVIFSSSQILGGILRLELIIPQMSNAYYYYYYYYYCLS
jgi:hypothetical protein